MTLKMSSASEIRLNLIVRIVQYQTSFWGLCPRIPAEEKEEWGEAGRGRGDGGSPLPCKEKRKVGTSESSDIMAPYEFTLLTYLFN